MNIQTDAKYGNYINSEMFGCTFFLIPFYSEKYRMIEYGFYSAPTFKDGSIDWDRQISITEWNTDDLEKNQCKEITDCWKALMKEVV